MHFTRPYKDEGNSESPGNPPKSQQVYTDERDQEQSEGRLVHISYDGWKHNNIRVLDSDKTSVLYNVDLRMKKPYMTIHSASSNTTIGTVNFHLLSSRIDTTIHGQSICMKSKGISQQDYCYDSPAFGGANLTWKHCSLLNPLDMVLLDDKSMPVARFIPINWSRKKTGKIDLLEPSTRNENVMDEVIASALALMYFREYQMGLASAGVVISA